MSRIYGGCQMNKEWIAFHLEEAAEQLQDTLKRLSSEPDYSFGDYIVDMSHAYHHMNTAWNSRDASPEAVANHTDNDYEEWQQMPSSDELMMGSLTEGK